MQRQQHNNGKDNGNNNGKGNGSSKSSSRSFDCVVRNVRERLRSG